MRPSHMSSEGALDKIPNVRREAFGSVNALQHCFCELAPLRFHHAPSPERREKPRRNVRVLRIEEQHAFADELIPGPIPSVELALVSLGEGADQRANTVRIAHRK